MSRSVRKLTAATGAAVLLAGLVTAQAPSAAANDRPSAIVSLGDSYISGEAAGDYEDGTDEPGNFCHRSKNAEIHETGIDVDKAVNLACSGATTENVRLGGDGQNGETSQAEQLRQVAKKNRVQLVVVSVGGNDVGFSDLVLDCIKGYFKLADRCQDAWEEKLPKDLATAKPDITSSLTDVRSVMRDAGYANGDYQLVVQSYPSPVTEKNRYSWTKAFEGCPLRNDDAEWARKNVVTQFAATLGAAAKDADARFLDQSQAFYGREICAKGVDHGQEWPTGINIDAGQIQNGLGPNIVQQSLHPNARGHAQFGNCLTGFFPSDGTAARCVRGADGKLTPYPISFAQLRQEERTGVVPRIQEPDPVKDKKRAYAKETKRRLQARLD